MSSNPPVIPDLSALTPLAGLIPNPIAAAAIIALLRGGPEFYAAIVNLIHNTNPTKADYLELLNFKLVGVTEQSYVDAARIAAGK